jgi:pimeloyl-ACP methyl ester carboxylesterase
MVRTILIACVFLYLLVLALVYFGQRNMMYHPNKKQIHELSFYNIEDAEEIFLITKDKVKLQAWFKKPKENHDMIIFLHGNAGNLEHRVDKLKQLDQMGYGFIIPAWRGFGKSDGTPTKEGLLMDAEAAIDYVKENNYKLSNVIMIGESLGSGVATEMAVKYKFKGLFLITPYTSISDRAGEIYPFLPTKYLTKDNFQVEENIANINQPLFIIHGTKDVVVPFQHSNRIFEHAKQPKKIIIYPGVGHNDYDVKEIFEEMRKFFDGIK